MSNTKLAAIREQMKSIFDEAVTETGEPREFTDGERKAFDLLAAKADAEVAAIEAGKAAEVQKAADRAKLESLAILPLMKSGAEAFEVGTSQYNQPAPSLLQKGYDAPASQSMGAAFVKSDSYQAALKQGGGQIMKGAHISVDTGMLVKTLLTSPTVGSTVRLIDNVVNRFGLMDAITTMPTGIDTILSHQYTLSTNAAAVRTEHAAAAESALTVTTATLTPADVAHALPVTQQALADHPRMEALINSILVRGLLNKIEVKVATDVAAWSGLATQAFATDVATTILKAKNAAEVYSQATGVILASSDYEALALLKGTANDHYIAPGPFGPAVFTVWGLPVYHSASVSAGFAYVGDLKMIVWNERNSITVDTGWVNTQFTEKEVTLLCSQRGMVDVMHNLAVVKADLTA